MQREEVKAIKLPGPWCGPSQAASSTCQEPAGKPSCPGRYRSLSPKKVVVWSLFGHENSSLSRFPLRVAARGSPCLLSPCLLSLPVLPACSPCLQRRRGVGGRAERVFAVPSPRTAMSSREERETLLTGSCRAQPAAAGPLHAARWGQTDRRARGQPGGGDMAAEAAPPPPAPCPKLHR